MNRFIKTTWFKILVALLVILLVFVIVAAGTMGGSSPLSSVVGTVAEPLSRVSAFVGRGFNSVSSFFTSSSKYEAEIEELEGQIAGYQAELADYEKTKQKLELYEEFLGVKEENPDYEVVPAVVIGKDSANAFTTFVFNKGSADGVAVNDPVIYGQGQLVGVVTKVSTTYCVVSTILDPTVSVSAYEVRTRETGFVLNDTDLALNALCRLSGLERTTSVVAGGIVCTTGVGGIYPRDLIIGTVKEVKNDERDISSYAVIEPSVDIEDLNDALILTAFEGQGASTEISQPTEEESTESETN